MRGRLKDKFKNIKEKAVNKLREQDGVVSLQFVIATMAALILFVTVFEEFQSQMIIRQVEAAADLAAVEALRMNIDEVAVRNESLSIDTNGDGVETYEDMDKVRNDFIRLIRDSLPEVTRIVRVEIPTISGGNVVVPLNYADAAFPNSTPAASGGNIFFDGAVTTEGKRVEYWLNGTATDNAAMSIVKDTTGLMTSNSDTKDRTSYFLTAKVLIIYKKYGLLSSARTTILNYVDILKGSGTSERLRTTQIDKNTAAVTIQAIGKVTMR